MKSILLLGLLFAFATTSQAQFLKKLKDKVNKTIGGDDSKSASTSETNDAGNATASHWCDTIQLEPVGGTGGDGVSYSKAYSGGAGNMNIVYSECSMGIRNDPSGYRLILSQYADGKTQFIVVENGNVVDRDSKVKPQYLGRGMQSDRSTAGETEEGISKYLVADSTKHIIPKSQAKSATIQKVDDDQMEMAINIIRQTDEYKSATDAEKQELEANLRKGYAMNNSMAGTTVSVPGSAGGSFSTISGYKLVVKKKNYGKFMVPPQVMVSDDELSVFAVGIDDKGVPVMVTQSKKTPLDKKRFSGSSGKMVRSTDHRKAVYLEPAQLTESDLKKMSAGGTYAMAYTALRNDGSVMSLTDHSGSGTFKLTNAGAIININESTGEVYADNKKLGQFTLASGDRIESDAVMIGSTPSSIAYFSGSNGSLNYLDGTVKKLGILYPSVVSKNGKTFMTWFRKCGNDIYIGRLSY